MLAWVVGSAALVTTPLEAHRPDEGINLSARLAIDNEGKLRHAGGHCIIVVVAREEGDISVSVAVDTGDVVHNMPIDSKGWRLEGKFQR